MKHIYLEKEIFLRRVLHKHEFLRNSILTRDQKEIAWAYLIQSFDAPNTRRAEVELDPDTLPYITLPDLPLPYDAPPTNVQTLILNKICRIRKLYRPNDYYRSILTPEQHEYLWSRILDYLPNPDEETPDAIFINMSLYPEFNETFDLIGFIGGVQDLLVEAETITPRPNTPNL